MAEQEKLIIGNGNLSGYRGVLPECLTIPEGVRE